MGTIACPHLHRRKRCRGHIWWSVGHIPKTICEQKWDRDFFFWEFMFFVFFPLPLLEGRVFGTSRVKDSNRLLKEVESGNPLSKEVLLLRSSFEKYFLWETISRLYFFLRVGNSFPTLGISLLLRSHHSGGFSLPPCRPPESGSRMGKVSRRGCMASWARGYGGTPPPVAFKSPLRWWWGEGSGSQNAILRHICYKGAFHLRQTGLGILGSAHRQGEEWVG